MSKGSPISPSLMATKSAGAAKASERVERPADAGVDTAAVSPVLGPNNVVPPTVMTGSQAIVRSLEELGVDDIFGLPGGAILPTYDPLMASSMNHVLVRHEQGAGHAAQGYAMVTGRVGVCIATSGPGATNLVTAIMDAHMDSVPLVAITGQVSSGVIGTDAFQEADIVGIEGHKAFLTKMGLLSRLQTELPEVATPTQPKAWKKINSMTISYGHGVSTTPLQTAVAAAALMNGGYLIPPTFLPRTAEEAQKLAVQVISKKTSDEMRYIYELNGEHGSGRQALVPGYRVGGKTGKAEKVVNGRYVGNKRFNAYLAAFPIDAPRYVTLVVIDEPQPVPGSGQGATAASNAAPTAGAIIRRSAALLKVKPDFNANGKSLLVSY